jgi:histidine triad (HIT) family protein
MADKTIFKRIIDGEIPARIIYQDDRCLAFHDIAPQAPTHVIVIPKQEIPSLAAVTAAEAPLMGHLVEVVATLARQLKLDDGYRVVVNCGPLAGQSVDHLHFHLLGGRPLSWPPG